jgi:hypothetical protein
MQLPPLMCGFVWRYYNVSKAIINNPYLMVYITHWNFGDGLRLPNITSYSSGSSEVFTIQNGPFFGDIPHFKAPKKGWIKTSWGDEARRCWPCFDSGISPFSIISPFNIIEYLHEYLYGLIHTSLYIYIYNIDVFIELYCDISDIPLKYVFFSIFLHETQRQTCNVPGSVVSLIHTMDTSVTWIGDPPAIFLGDQPGGKQHYVYISVIQSL